MKHIKYIHILRITLGAWGSMIMSSRPTWDIYTYIHIYVCISWPCLKKWHRNPNHPDTLVKAKKPCPQYITVTQVRWIVDGILFVCLLAQGGRSRIWCVCDSDFDLILPPPLCWAKIASVLVDCAPLPYPIFRGCCCGVTPIRGVILTDAVLSLQVSIYGDVPSSELLIL